MTTIELRFPAHRFHATPWGRHVNEGVVEWPPSPYRILRSLYDAWKRKHPALPETDVAELFQALSAEPPRFSLPRATASHTRSYLNSNTEDPTDKSLIFDAFVAVSPGDACYVIWPRLNLPARQREMLDCLLGSVNFVGRSESWVEAKLFEGEVRASIPCEPLSETELTGDAIPVACATPAAEYRETRPWMDAIAYSTVEFLKDRRSLPPAMRMVRYVRPPEALMTRVLRPPRGHAGTQAVLLGLDAPVLPLVTATIEIAEQIRVRLMGIHRRLMGDDPTKVSPKFSGKSSGGTPLRDHQHAFILPIGNEVGRIDRILIYTRHENGFDSSEVQAILRVRSLYRSGSPEGVSVVATWRGPFDDDSVRPRVNVVESRTPFVAPRYWRKGRGSVEEFLKSEVRRECRNHRLPAPAAVHLLPKSPELFEWVEFRRNRKDDAPRPGYGFRIEFPEAVAAPFSLGYGCHFGLGQFDRPR